MEGKTKRRRLLSKYPFIDDTDDVADEAVDNEKTLNRTEKSYRIR